MRAAKHTMNCWLAAAQKCLIHNIVVYEHARMHKLDTYCNIPKSRRNAPCARKPGAKKKKKWPNALAAPQYKLFKHREKIFCKRRFAKLFFHQRTKPLAKLLRKLLLDKAQFGFQHSVILSWNFNAFQGTRKFILNDPNSCLCQIKINLDQTRLI